MATIQTFCRIKPSSRLYENYDTSDTSLFIRTSDSYREASAFKQPESGVSHKFTFAHVFRDNACQEEVFEVVSKDIVNHFLTGYNGTIFAYGQTGTGKTFTVEGSARRYKDRGLAPRALSMIYKELESRPEDEDNSIHVSYLEIYQETAYDLLNPAATRTQSLVTPFPKVHVLEGTKGSCVIRNLSTHLAANEDVAQSLLLQGQANRKVAETPMNQRSSRSHAVFTIELKSKKSGSDVITHSKLHLVDLAGSERVGKTKVGGVQLTEAKYINLSLHYLESVIIALHQESQGKGHARTPSAGVGSGKRRHAPYPRVFRSKTVPSLTASSVRRPATSDGYGRTSKHIPYRNSVLTMVLRDSLGGNCLTAMIATISLEVVNLGESLSTCRFAQRVACISNNARRNEEVDDKSMIKRLKARISELEAELALLKFGGKVAAKLPDGVEVNTVLTDEDKLKCANVVKKFVAGVITDPILGGITDLYQFRECMNLLKDLIASTKDNSGARPISSGNLSLISSATSGFIDESDASKQRPITMESIQSVGQEVDIQMATPASANLNTSDSYGWTGGSLNADWNSDKPPSTQPTPKKRVVYTSTPEFRFGSHKAREAFKTPFEKKKERDVKKLNDKVEKMYANQLEEQQHLVEFQTSVKEQQLELIEKELQASVDRCREQLADQHAYVLSLKRNEADPDLIQQEKLVERQLKKREHKLHKRLKVIGDQKEAIQKEYQQQEVPLAGSPRRDLHEKFSEFTNSGGKLNVRQVKQILQSQEKEQLQYQKKIERQRIMAVSKQLEVKEMSTRQKLMEFKEKLRMSQSGGSPATSLFGNLNNSRPATTDDKWISNGHLPVSESFAMHSTEMKVEDIENGPVYSPTSAAMNHENAVNHSSVAELIQPSFPASTSISSKDLFEKSPSDRFDSSKNHNQDGLSGLETPSVPYTSPLFKALHGDKMSREFNSTKEQHGMDRTVKKSSIFVKGPRPSKGHTSQHETIGTTWNRGDESWNDNSVSTNSFGKVSAKDKIQKNDDADLLGQYKNNVKKRSPRQKEDAVFGRLLDDDDLLQQFVYERKHPRKTKETSFKGNSKQLTDNAEFERDHASGDKIRPSEYVSKSANGNFDARKMGLSANSFDSTLSNMLGETKVGLPSEFYDQYARPQKDSRSRDENNDAAKLVKQLSKSRSSYDAKKFRIDISSSHEDTRKSTRVKAGNHLLSGNDSKQSERLANPDSSHSKGAESKKKTSPREFIVPKKSFFKLQKEKPISEETESPPREFIVPKKAFFFKPQIRGSSSEPNDEEVKPEKITAMKESQREETYMSTALQQKDRVLKIRQAIRAAEVIQRAWHRFKARKK